MTDYFESIGSDLRKDIIVIVTQIRSGGTNVIERYLEQLYNS